MTPSTDPARWEQAVAAREVRVGIIGMGYVGLPLALTFAEKGFRVVGFDIDKAKVRRLNAGGSYILHVPARRIAAMRRLRRFRATAEHRHLRDVDAILICVPTPLDSNEVPDLSFIEETGERIFRTLRRGQLVVLESTTYPGTTREILRDKHFAGRGNANGAGARKRPGLRTPGDYLLAYSPEREDPGNPSHATATIPKVVGADDPRSLRAAAALYGAIAPRVVPVGSTCAAEACKLLENIYRCVNIALVNELKVIFDQMNRARRMGLDIWEVIQAAATKPFGFQPFYPGPGLGGHCIPLDPYYLSWKAREAGAHAPFIEHAGEVNKRMPEFVVHKTMDALNERRRSLNGSRILVLGVAYKKDVDDMRESPACEIIEFLRDRGARVDFSDPHIPRIPLLRAHPTLQGMSSVPLTRAALRRYDAALIVTDHAAVDYAFVVRHAPLVVDTRNATAKVRGGREKIVRA